MTSMPSTGMDALPATVCNSTTCSNCARKKTSPPHGTPMKPPCRHRTVASISRPSPSSRNSSTVGRAVPSDITGMICEMTAMTQLTVNTISVLSPAISTPNAPTPLTICWPHSTQKLHILPTWISVRKSMHSPSVRKMAICSSPVGISTAHRKTQWSFSSALPEKPPSSIFTAMKRRWRRKTTPSFTKSNGIPPRSASKGRKNFPSTAAISSPSPPMSLS